MDFESVSFSISAPGGIASISGTWTPNEVQQKAAWEMYVELVTRVTVIKLNPDEGLLREALSSFYSLFGSTREILRSHGPDVAKSNKDESSFGVISISVLNQVLRPVLAKWHPLLLDYESQRSDQVSQWEHEKSWERHDELRKVLEDVRHSLIEYAETLSRVAGVPSLIIQERSEAED